MNICTSPLNGLMVELQMLPCNWFTICALSDPPSNCIRRQITHARVVSSFLTNQNWRVDSGCCSLFYLPICTVNHYANSLTTGDEAAIPTLGTHKISFRSEYIGLFPTPHRAYSTVCCGQRHPYWLKSLGARGIEVQFSWSCAPRRTLQIRLPICPEIQKDLTNILVHMLNIY